MAAKKTKTKKSSKAAAPERGAKKAHVLKLLKAHPDLSDKEIAEKADCSPTYVYSLRNPKEAATPAAPKQSPKAVKGKPGRPAKATETPTGEQPWFSTMASADLLKLQSLLQTELARRLT